MPKSAGHAELVQRKFRSTLVLRLQPRSAIRNETAANGESRRLKVHRAIRLRNATDYIIGFAIEVSDP